MTTFLLPTQRAQSWLASQKLGLYQLAVLQRTRLHVRGVERVEPGYADELRAAALAAIAGSDLTQPAVRDVDGEVCVDRHEVSHLCARDPSLSA